MRFAVAALGLALPAGCGGGKPESTPATQGQRPGCPPHVGSTSLPAGFPRALPLPPGTVITSVGRPAPGSLFVRGLAPGGLSKAALFFERRLPAAGFRLGEGDAEPGEAESAFSGRGVAGKWKVNSIAGCVRDVAVLVAIEKTS